MRHILMFLCIVALLLGRVGNVNALTFTDTQILNKMLSEDPNPPFDLLNTYAYTHKTPTDFQIPWDTVTSATLEITGYWIDGNDDTVEIGGQSSERLMPAGTKPQTVSSFDVFNTFSPWFGTPLEVVITAHGTHDDESLILLNSTLTIEYENQVAPVPEPSTILLLGAGLLGLTGFRRKRFRTEG